MNAFTKKKCGLRGAFGHVFLALGVVALLIPSVYALQDGAARTPPMGFNTWNYFGCNGINETNVFNVAKSLVQTHPANWEGKVISLKDVGYKYVNLDDCWESSRDGQGNPRWDTRLFPKGFPWLCDTVEKMGLKMGIYTDCGTATCAGRFGTLDHDRQDAEAYVKWGFHYVKEDWCNVPGQYMNQQGCLTLYKRMGDALVAAAKAADSVQPGVDHKVILSLCQWGNYNVASWGDQAGHLWRTTGDIVANWGSVMGNFGSSLGNYQYAKPGAWNDPDMLEVGNGSLNANENQAHFDMWCIVAAPLLLGNNTPAMTEATFTILSNREVIAVDQDSLGYQGRRTRTGPDVWSKKMNRANNWVIMILNTGSGTANGTVQATDMPGLTLTSMAVRDLHTHKWLTPSAQLPYSVPGIPSHGTAMLLFAPDTLDPLTMKYPYPAYSNTLREPEKAVSVSDRGLSIMTRTRAGSTEVYIPSNGSTLQVFTTQGRQVASLSASQPGWLPLNRQSFVKGMYLVRLKGLDGATGQKTVLVK